MQHPTLIQTVARERQLDHARDRTPAEERVLPDGPRAAMLIRSTEPRAEAPWPVAPVPERNAASELPLLP